MPAIGGLRVAGYASTGDRAFLTADPRVSYGLVFTPYHGELSPPSFAPQITAVMTRALPAGSRVQVTGMNELVSGGQARQGFGVLSGIPEVLLVTRRQPGACPGCGGGQHLCG
jgi:putative drug exporter of the RND superfamily